MKIIDSVNASIKLAISAAVISLLGGMAIGGLRLYHRVAVMTASPIKVPDVELPQIKLEVPQITLKAPSIGLSGILGGKAEPEGPTFGKNWEMIGGDLSAFGPPPPPPSSNGCPHNPPCKTKEQHLLKDLSSGEISGEWVGP